MISSIFKNFKPKFPSFVRILGFFIIVAAGAGLDLWSKSAVFKYMQNNYTWEKPVIDGFFNLVVRENTGAAWSSFAGQRVFLVSISAVAFIFVVLIFFSGQVKYRLSYIATCFFGAGILGNLYDRMFNDGKVRDFLDFYITLDGKEQHWPAFNVADSMLCVAVGLLIISSLIQSKHKDSQVSTEQ